jgi:hypothetical protein
LYKLLDVDALAEAGVGTGGKADFYRSRQLESSRCLGFLLFQELFDPLLNFAKLVPEARAAVPGRWRVGEEDGWLF